MYLILFYNSLDNERTPTKKEAEEVDLSQAEINDESQHATGIDLTGK